MRSVPTLVLIALTWLAGPPAAIAQERLEIFDAHMHYNQEPNPFYPLDKVLEVYRRNHVTGILATSRPDRKSVV